MSFNNNNGVGGEDLSKSALSTFKAKEEEIERKRMEAREKVRAQLGRVEEKTKHLAFIREFVARFLSTGSFFHDRSITPGKPRTWLFSLCSKYSTDVKNPTSQPSLGHFLAVERRASTTSNVYARSRNPNTYLVPDEDSMAQHISATNSLFVDGEIAPPAHLQSGSRSDEEAESGIPVLLSCMCGQAAAH